MRNICCLCLAIILASNIAKAQNAYHDSKYIMDWYYRDIKLPLSNADREIQKEVLVRLYSYREIEARDSLMKYPLVQSILKKIINLQDVLTVQRIDSTWTGQDQRHLRGSAKKIIEESIAFMNKYRADTSERAMVIGTFETEMVHTDLFSPGVLVDSGRWVYLDVIIKEDSLYINDTLSVPKNVDIDLQGYRDSIAIRDYLQNLLKSLPDRYLSYKKTQLHRKNDTLAVEIAKYKNDVKVMASLYKINEDKYKRTRSGDPLYSEIFNPQDITQISGKIQDEAQRTQAAPAVQLANFTMPSEAQMIDAMAIYIAKRFKQEAVVHMMDVMRRNAVGDTLFATVFPETRKLLYSMEEYSVPGFGSDWRYALSKDYALMPRNLLSSPYIQRQLPEWTFKSLNDGWRVADMVNKKYNYIDIIRSCYEAELQTDAMRRFIRWAYIANEEFFTVAPKEFKVSDSNNRTIPDIIKNYWITPEELSRNASLDQLSLMLILISEKYNLDLRKETGIDLVATLDSQKTQLLKIKSWMSRVLLMLNHFQKAQNFLYAAEAQHKDEFNVISYWSMLNDIMTTVVDTSIFPSARRYLHNLHYSRSVYEIYNSLQHKNYPAAMQQCISLLDEIGAKNSEIISAKLNIHYKKTWDDINDLGPGDAGKKLPLYASYFTPATLQSDNRAALAVLGRVQAEINNDLKRQNNQSDTITLYMQQFDSKDPESYKAVDSLINSTVSRIKEMNLSSTIESTLIQKTTALKATVTDTLKKRFQMHLEKHHNSYYASLAMLRTTSRLFNDVIIAGNDPHKLSQVIESAAAPVGSYKIKRTRRFTIDLGAYLGAFAGVEWLPNQNGKNTAFAYGLTVPIGINFNWGQMKVFHPGEDDLPYIRKNGSRKGTLRTAIGSSWTVSLSIVDIAGPVAFRLSGNNDTTGSGLPETVKWGQLIAPGIHVRYGFKNAPICISAGLQFTPELRNVIRNEQKDETGTVIRTESVSSQNAMRAYLGVVYDLPLLYFKR